MRKIWKIFLIILSVTMAAQPGIAEPENPPLASLITSGKNQLYHFNLDSALQTFRQIQNAYPDFPHGYFYEAYIYAIFYSQDRTNRHIDSLLMESVSKALDKGDKFKDQTENKVEAYYYLGVTNGILGIYHVLNSSYLKGYIHGRRGKNYLEDAIKLDSTYYDAYLGLGIFHYYVDLLPGIIKFFASILGFEGDRRQGLQEVQLTMNQGDYFRTEGEFTYAMIRYFLEGDYHSPISIFKNLHQKYPQNPAFTLIIGYHYRRHGQIKLAETYFLKVPELYTDKLPQITVMKYYNLAVCYYRLNQFEESDRFFTKLLDTSLRKSQYYLAAITHYKGVLAGVEDNRQLSQYYFSLLYDNKETEYWYNLSRFYANHPFDDVMKHFIMANNNIYSRNQKKAAGDVDWLVNYLEAYPSQFKDSDFKFMIRDVQARFSFQKGQIQQAKDIYDLIISDLDDFKDDFQRAWIYIAYARVLRELKDWKNSEKMLDKASGSHDEYTLLIIEREKYILKNLQENSKS